jgi:hypothetical protein
LALFSEVQNLLPVMDWTQKQELPLPERPQKEDMRLEEWNMGEI